MAKMMADRESVLEMAAALRKASRLLLVAHLSPDGDSLGSLLALRRALIALDKAAIVFVPDGVPPKYRFLSGWEEIVTEASLLPKEPGVIVLLDCGEWERSGLPDSYRGYPLLNIDHHRTSSGIGRLNLVNSAAAATGELIYLVLQALGVPLDIEIATCIYTAIASDTGWFRFSNTTPSIYRLAAELLEHGANQDLVNDFLTAKPLAYLQVLSLVLERLTVFCRDQAAISWVSYRDLQRIGIPATEIEGLIDYPRSLPGVQVAALLVETAPAVCKVSLRSRHPVDVSQLAQQFGGGGHARAAGCTLSLRCLEDCLIELRAAIERGLGGVPD